jgi:hypothetical protein
VVRWTVAGRRPALFTSAPCSTHLDTAWGCQAVLHLQWHQAVGCGSRWLPRCMRSDADLGGCLAAGGRTHTLTHAHTHSLLQVIFFGKSQLDTTAVSFQDLSRNRHSHFWAVPLRFFRSCITNPPFELKLAVSSSACFALNGMFARCMGCFIVEAAFRSAEPLWSNHVLRGRRAQQDRCHEACFFFVF